MVSPLVLLCLARALWRTLRHGGGHVVSGHDYRIDPRTTTSNVLVLTCRDCGAESFGWNWLPGER